MVPGGMTAGKAVTETCVERLFLKLNKFLSNKMFSKMYLLLDQICGELKEKYA